MRDYITLEDAGGSETPLFPPNRASPPRADRDRDGDGNDPAATATPPPPSSATATATAR